MSSSVRLAKRQVPTALESSALTYVIDDQAAHGARGVSEKSIPIRKRDGAALRNIEIGFMQQTGSAQCEASGTSMDMRLCEPVQLIVERREQGILRHCIAGIDPCSETTDQICGFVAHVLAL